jgi:hypothetical protein
VSSSRSSISLELSPCECSKDPESDSEVKDDSSPPDSGVKAGGSSPSRLIAIASSRRCEYLGAKRVGGNLLVVDILSFSTLTGRFEKGASWTTGGGSTGRDLRGCGIARRPTRGVKSGTSTREALIFPPNGSASMEGEAVERDMDKGVKGVLGRATCPERCLRCSARARSMRLSLKYTM